MRNSLYSIVLLSYNSEKRIESVYRAVKDSLDKEEIPFEFIIIDDGSKDKSYKKSLELEKRQSNVRAYQLSKNYSSQYSKFAGFSLAKGGIITSMPDDGQVPLSVYIKMYRLWRNGEKVLIPFRESRSDGLISDFFSKSYYSIMNYFSEVKFPKGGADVFAIDREVLEIVNNKIHPINTSMLVEVLRLGFDPFYFGYERTKNLYCKSRWTMKKKIRLAKDTFFTSSSFPIKFITGLGIASFVLSVFLVLFSIWYKLYGQKYIAGFSIPGWTTSLIFTSLFSGLILLSLGIISEYIWRIYEEVKNRPGYIIRNKNKDN